MKKAGLIFLIFITVAALAAGQETGGTGNLFSQWQKALEENKIPGVPALFVKKIHSAWIGVGFMLNSPNYFDEKSPVRTLLEAFPLFQLALFLKTRKTSSSLMLSYEKMDVWGLSIKFSF